MSYSQQVPPIIALTLDLGQARAGVQIVPPGQPVRQVYVALLPQGADLRLRAGYSNPGIPMVQTGGQVFFSPLLDGVYLDNAAQPGLVAVLAITTGEKSAT